MPSASSADPDAEHTPEPIVVLDTVTVRHGTVTALEAVDLRIGPGERLALVGQSGAGKSTLLSLLGGLVGPTEGRVRVLGTDLGRGRPRRAHRARIGIVSQQLHLPGALRVIHNVNAGRLGRRSTAAALWSLVRPDGVDEARAVLAEVGLGDVTQARTGTLSGGEQQRVAVARVLRQRPDLVLADEPVSAVDPRLSDDVAAVLCAPAAPWTTVISLHDPDLARRHATRMVGLREGRVVFDRPPASVGDDDLRALYDRDTDPS